MYELLRFRFYIKYCCSENDLFKVFKILIDKNFNKQEVKKKKKIYAELCRLNIFFMNSNYLFDIKFIF